MLVALERNRVVGFAVISPAADPDSDPVADAEVQELTVDPGRARQGHGSRLLQAVRRHAAGRPVHPGGRLDGGRATTTSARFLTEAGWAPDTAHRELDLDGDRHTTVKQVRLHTAL